MIHFVPSERMPPCFYQRFSYDLDEDRANQISSCASQASIIALQSHVAESKACLSHATYANADQPPIFISALSVTGPFGSFGSLCRAAIRCQDETTRADANLTVRIS